MYKIKVILFLFIKLDLFFLYLLCIYAYNVHMCVYRSAPLLLSCIFSTGSVPAETPTIKRLLINYQSNIQFAILLIIVTPFVLPTSFQFIWHPRIRTYNKKKFEKYLFFLQKKKNNCAV